MLTGFSSSDTGCSEFGLFAHYCIGDYSEEQRCSCQELLAYQESPCFATYRAGSAFTGAHFGSTKIGGSELLTKAGFAAVCPSGMRIRLLPH